MARSTVQTAYQALVELEKGVPGSARNQLQEAGRIIGLDLDSLFKKSGEAPNDSSQIPSEPAPKEEWVLRWLLKKLKNTAQNDSTASASGYSADVYSWTLLRELVNRIPPKPLAGILGENKILNIVGDVLEGLEKSHTVSVAGYGAVMSTFGNLTGSESPNRGRKRKRSETEDGNVASRSSGRDSLLAMLAFVERLVMLLSRLPDGQAAVKSQLKLVLRGDAGLASQILGRALRVGGDASRQLSEAETANATNELQGLLRVLVSTVAIWEHRSSNGGNVADNEAFALHSLPPALCLLSNMQSLPRSANTDAIKHHLEKLLALHVILPLREHFFSLQSNRQSTDNSPKPEQVEAVMAEIASWLPPDTHYRLLPALFDVGIRSVPRDTFRRQLNEAPWLETFFVALAACAGCPIVIERSQETDRECVSILQQLLQVAINQKLDISLPTLLHYGCKFSGLISDAPAEIHWQLVSLLMALNPDVFLPNSGYPDSKILLDNLLRRITPDSQFENVSYPETYQIIKAGIIIPLLRGFAGARDLEAFVRIWKEQIVTHESAASPQADLHIVWHDSELLETFGDLVSSTFSVGYIRSQVEELVSVVLSDDHTSPSSETHASIIVLDALLMSKLPTDGNFIDCSLFDKVVSAMCSLLTSNGGLQWRWRLWRITQNIFDKFPLSAQQAATAFTETVLTTGLNSVRLVFESSKTVLPQVCHEAFCFSRFIAFVVTRSDMSKAEESLNAIVSLFKPGLSLLKTAEDPAWDGRIETLRSRQTVAVGCFLVLLEYPAAAVKLSSENRRLFFTTILFALSESSAVETAVSAGLREHPSSLSEQLAKIWDGFASADWLLAASPAVYDMLSVMCTRFTEERSLDAKTSLALRTLLLRDLLAVPSRLIPLALRSNLLDYLSSVLAHGSQDLYFRTTESGIELEILALMKKLVEVPKSNIRTITDSTGLWSIAESLAPAKVESISSRFRAFQKLHGAVVDRIMLSSEENRRECISKTWNDIQSQSVKLNEANGYASLTFFLLCLSLNLVHARQDLLGDKSKAEGNDALRKDIFQHLIATLQSLARKAKKSPAELKEGTLLGVLSDIETFPDLAQSNRDMRKAIEKIDKYLSKSDVEVNIYTRKLLKRRCIAQAKRSDLLPEIMNKAPSFPIYHPYASEQCAFVHEIRQRVQSMTIQQRVDLVANIRQSATGGDGFSPYQLVVAGMAISSFSQIESRDSPEAVELSPLLTSLADSLPRFTSVESFSLATECIDLVLRTHPRSVSQWNIDNLLAAVSTCTSRFGPQIPREHAGAVYTRLTRLLGTLFGLFRKKLSGRFHLILPPLQRLLQCLFTRDSRASSSTKLSPILSELPPWLGNMDETPLHADHAGQFTRLLASLCDPTVSAVQLQTRGSSSGLSDSTKKVKSLAGQYLQYVITEYTGAQLRGHLSPAMKAALMPGLYSVLDVMSRNTMRAMNAGMDSSSRAMFKGLYDDYMRFGKWNHD